MSTGTAKIFSVSQKIWVKTNMSKLKIKASYRGQTIIIPEGRVDSTNAQDFSNFVLSARNEKPEASIVLDCAGLQYISSAGLRVLLTIQKKNNTPLTLRNVQPEVMDILDVTGFSQIFMIENTVKEDSSQEIKDISGKHAALMGESGGAAIYRMDNDMILKLSPSGTSLQDIQTELTQSKAALICGVPTLISYDAVKYNGRYGIRCEMPNVRAVSSLLSFQQWNLSRHASEMGKTLRHIHTCRPEKGVLPKTSELFTGYAKRMGQYLNESEVSKLIDMINVIPDADTFVYGSYHSGNVFVLGDELILIDMSGISCGNPIFDLGMTYMIYVLEAEWLSKPLTGLDVQQAKIFWDLMMRSYFGTNDNADIKQYEPAVTAAAVLCSAVFPAINRISQEDSSRLVMNTKKKLTAVYNTLYQVLANADFKEEI